MLKFSIFSSHVSNLSSRLEYSIFSQLGYGTSFAADIIRESKKLMIAKGHTYYQSRKLDRVPKEAVEELLGITLSEKQD